MTDRISVLTVALEEPIRDDDVQVLIDAILMLRGVAAVTTHVSNPDTWFAVEHAHRTLGQAIIDAIREDRKL